MVFRGNVRASVVALVVGLLLLVSCGGGGGNSTSPAAGTSDASSTATPAPSLPQGTVATPAPSASLAISPVPPPTPAAAPPAPTIFISAPTTTGNVTSTTATVRVQGVVSSDVTQVTFTAPLAQGSATLSRPAWSTSDIPLAGGDNFIQVAAVTADGGRSTSTVDVVYNPTLSMSTLTLTPPEMLAGTPAQVQASIAIDDVATLQRGNVTLHQVDAVGADLGVVATMQDGGVSGGRRTFTVGITVTAQSPQTSSYRVFAPIAAGTALSEIRTVRAYRPLSLEEAQAALDALDAAWQTYSGSQQNGASKAAGMQAAIASLSHNAAVDSVSSIPADDDATVYFKSGIVGIFSVPTANTRGGGPPSTARGLASQGPGPRLSFDAITACGFTTDFSGYDDSETAKTALDKIPSVTTCRSADQECGVDFFASFTDKRVIYYAGHGSAMVERGFDFASVETAHPELTEDQIVDLSHQYCTPVTITAELATAEDMKHLYSEKHFDIPGERIVISSAAGEARYGLRPEFILNRYATDNLKNSLVAMTCCYSAVTDKMALAYRAVGAGAYVGYDRKVTNSFASTTAQQFMSQMVNGSTTYSAFQSMNVVDPELHEWAGHTRFHLIGDPLLTINAIPDIFLTPASAHVTPASPTNVRITVGLADVDLTYNPSPFTYHWTCSGIFGHPEDDIGNKGTELDTVKPTVTWVPEACPADSGRDAGAEQVDVKVMLAGPCTEPKQMVNATCTVSVDACPSPSPSPSPSASPKWTISAPASTTSSTPITITAIGPAANNYNWSAASPTAVFQDQFNHQGHGSLTTTSPFVTYFNSSGPVNVTETVSLNIDFAPQGIVPRSFVVAPETCTPRAPVMSVCANDLQATGSAVPGGVITLTVTQQPGLSCGAGGILLSVNGVPGSYTNLGGGTLQAGAVFFAEPVVPTSRSVTFTCSANKLNWFGQFPCARAQLNAANLTYSSSVPLTIAPINWP